MSTITISQSEYDQLTSKVKKLENRLEKSEKEIRRINFSFWLIPIAGLIGWYWDDIIRFFTGS